MKLTRRQSLVLLGVSVLLVAGLLSLLASPFPDALEDSLESHGTQGLAEGSGGSQRNPEAGQDGGAEKRRAPESDDGSQMWSSPLPDYTVPGVKDENLGGAMAGILGVAATFVALLLLLYLLRQRRRGDSEGRHG